MLELFIGTIEELIKNNRKNKIPIPDQYIVRIDKKITLLFPDRQFDNEKKGFEIIKEFIEECKREGICIWREQHEKKYGGEKVCWGIDWVTTGRYKENKNGLNFEIDCFACFIVENYQRLIEFKEKGWEERLQKICREKNIDFFG